MWLYSRFLKLGSMRSINVATFLDSNDFGYKINTINPPKSDSFL